MGATTLGSCSPRLAQTWCSSFEQSSLLHKPKTLPQTGVLAKPGNDVLCDLRLSPVFFFLGFFSHLFGLWVSQGRDSSPEPVECSPQRLSTTRKNYWSGEGATASPVRKKTTYFPLEKKPPHKPQLLPAVPMSKKKAEKWGWVTAHTRPEPARQSSEHRKMKLLLLRNRAWLFQDYRFSLNYYVKKTQNEPEVWPKL